MKIAVYCGSVSGTEPEYMAVARKLGDWIGRNGHELVYGGSKTGLMGEVADAVLKHGGRVIGVLPDVPLIHERRHPGLSECHLTGTMSARKDKMIALSDAYIALPGGFGTLDEISDVLCLNRLQLIRKPCVLVNTRSFYEPVRNLILNMIDSGFVGGEEMDMLRITDDVEEIAEFVEGFC